MRKLINGLVLLLLLAGAAQAASDAKAPRCKPRLLADVDLARAQDGTYLIPMNIGDESVWFVLNTGTSIPMLPQPAIERLHLETTAVSGDAQRITVGKDRITRKTTFASLSTGGFRYSNVIAGIMPNSADTTLEEFDGKPVVGYFGMEILSRTDFELHLAQKKLRLFAPDHCRSVGAYWANDYAETSFGLDPYGGLYFAMGLEGKLIETALSTGSPMTTIDDNVTRKAYGFDASSPGVEVTDQGRATYRAMALTMPGLNVKDIRIRLRTDAKDCGYRERIDSGRKAISYGKCTVIFPALLGRDVLERLRLYVSLRQREIYFTEANAGL